ncbi:fimbrial assembly protein PilN [Campylobacter rectus RM3267]|uniref:Uncharacterized protein n=2 Tax=Campylobacter rectus TaxID=203 RepID=A0A6G5QNN6_CAMRE|nr:hypothetical protein [Campylobacter rectus]EEF13021.1 fimbrial assembly protein PilN [Campylobacter rectus RM3267]QCD47363.1 hypothetical protein CRECT_1733 [Campylobacter rectus]RRD52430.1 hypothetical protein EII16_10935 [Campylobacter rectus]UEB48057.1 hypothetical protein LK437_01645 [Campylobacter rectus]
MTSYSFIKPQKKPIFSLFSKIWMLFISTVVLLFAAVNLFVELKSGSLRNETQISKQKQDQIKEQIKQTDELTALLKQRRDSANEILASNAVLKQSVRNLLDLVPSSITLNEIAMDKNSLVVKGTTPSRDVYNMLLATPLKSIFNTSNTSFYQLDSGWLNFISTNKTDSLEGKNE